MGSGSLGLVQATAGSRSASELWHSCSVWVARLGFTPLPALQHAHMPLLSACTSCGLYFCFLLMRKFSFLPPSCSFFQLLTLKGSVKERRRQRQQQRRRRLVVSPPLLENRLHASLFDHAHTLRISLCSMQWSEHFFRAANLS